MAKTSTQQTTSKYPHGTSGIVYSDNDDENAIGSSKCEKPSAFVINNILNYARSLEVLKTKDQMLFYFVKN